MTAVHSAKAGHPGGSLSAQIFSTYLYFEEMNIDPRSQEGGQRTVSYCPGHTLRAFSVLANRGYFPVKILKTLRHWDSYLQGHPCMQETPGVDMSSGSLGQGISAASVWRLRRSSTISPTNIPPSWAMARSLKDRCGSFHVPDIVNLIICSHRGQ